MPLVCSFLRCGLPREHPWTSEQAEKLSEELAKVSAANSFQKLVDRTEPPSEEARTLLLDELFARATVSDEKTVRKGERSMAHKIMEHNLKTRSRSRDAADFFSAGLLRSLLQLEEKLKNLEFKTRVWYSETGLYYWKTKSELFKLVGSLAWIFRLPHSPGEMDIRRNVVELMALLQVRCEAELYKTQIFYRYIARSLYAPVIKAVAEGSLVIGAELRTKLLRMWVPGIYDYYSKDRNSEAMQAAAFSAVLSTVGFQIQEQILHDWMSDLVGTADPLEPWVPGMDDEAPRRRIEGKVLVTCSVKAKQSCTLCSDRG
jgi:hypothetical protein